MDNQFWGVTFYDKFLLLLLFPLLLWLFLLFLLCIFI